MPIRNEVNGKAGHVLRIYGSENQKARRIRKVYIERNGKAALYYNSGSGTRSDPYLISSFYDLWRIKYDPAAYYRITEDLSLPDIPHMAAKTFPILPVGTPFTGVLDGAGHSIRYDSGISYSARVIDGNWKRDKDAYSYEVPFGLLFQENAGIITRLRVESSFTLTNYLWTGVGGIAGVNKGIIDQVFLRYPIGGYRAQGGIAYRNEGTIQNCLLTAMRQGNSYRQGFAYTNAGTLLDCIGFLSQSQGQIKTNAYCYQNEESGTIKRCISIAEYGKSVDKPVEINNGTMIQSGEADQCRTLDIYSVKRLIDQIYWDFWDIPDTGVPALNYSQVIY